MGEHCSQKAPTAAVVVDLGISPYTRELLLILPMVGQGRFYGMDKLGLQAE